ncbi:MAG: hypothetical protein ABFS22_06700 [Pseudomonadota bacterium]
MQLPLSIYKSKPTLYVTMGLATQYFAIEAAVLEKGLPLAVFISITGLCLIAFGLHIRRLRQRTGQQ